MPKYEPRDPRQPRWPQPQNNIPRVKTIDGALSHIAKKRSFYAPKLLWEDRDHTGKLIASTTYSISATNHAPRGIRKCYLVSDNGATETNGRLFLYDYGTGKWFRNKAASLETEDHPLYPSTPPDEPVIALPPREFIYLINHDFFDLMSKKVEGFFSRTKWTGSELIYTIDDWGWNDDRIP